MFRLEQIEISAKLCYAYSTNKYFIKGGSPMLRKLILLILSAMLILNGFAENDLTIENIPPDEPIITEGEFIRVIAEYDVAADLTRYTAQMNNDPVFADGAPITAQDLLFSLYVYLDPSYPEESLPSIPGLESYRRQISAERLQAASETMSAIRAAGSNHKWSAEDPWSESLQKTYWQLQSQYSAACAREFPPCAQSIVDYCSEMLSFDPQGAFGYTSEEIAGDEGLRVAYAMLQWGYATANGNLLTARRSGLSWPLEAGKPSVDDFADELSLAYGGDLGACWAVESTGLYEPKLPDVAEAFLTHYLGNTRDSVISISGIRLTDDGKLEIDIEGIDMHMAEFLFARPVLSLNAQGDASLWSPETGLYGHPFGDISAVKSFDGPMLMENLG